MSEMKLSQQQVIHVFSAGILLLVFMIWMILLNLLNYPLNFQGHSLDNQLQQIRLLNHLPQKWASQISYIDITQLMQSLNKNLQQKFPKNGNSQMQQVNKTELQAKISNVDEQDFIKWLWTMQQEYAFQVVRLSITPHPEPAIVDVQVNLQLLN
jgi:type II secretory pathway component PulM